MQQQLALLDRHRGEPQHLGRNLLTEWTVAFRSAKGRHIHSLAEPSP